MSRVFEDSEDEFEDDFTESIELIMNLGKRLEQKQKPEDIVQTINDHRIEEDPIETKPQTPVKNRIAVVDPTNSAIQTRSSNRQKAVSESKTERATTSYEENRTIEVLMEELDEETDEIEYMVADSVDAISEEPFHSTDSNDELNALLVDDDGFDAEPFVLQNISKDNELDITDESMDEKSVDDEDTGKCNNLHSKVN